MVGRNDDDGDLQGFDPDLTNHPNRAKLEKSKNKVFVFKASWPSTSKYITVIARDLDMAFDKAYARRDLKGCKSIDFIREKEG